MTNGKAYTNLEQSKKLAKFLPLESADMRFCFSHTLGGRITGHYPMIGREPSSGTIPCWSLAALINVLPKSIKFKDNKYYLRFMKDYVEYANDTFSITGRCLHTIGNNNLVDACYEMIIKLHEQNLLWL